jgi:hypothetical protein
MYRRADKLAVHDCAKWAAISSAYEIISDFNGFGAIVEPFGFAMKPSATFNALVPVNGISCQLAKFSGKRTYESLDYADGSSLASRFSLPGLLFLSGVCFISHFLDDVDASLPVVF